MHMLLRKRMITCWNWGYGLFSEPIWMSQVRIFLRFFMARKAATGIFHDQRIFLRYPLVISYSLRYPNLVGGSEPPFPSPTMSHRIFFRNILLHLGTIILVGPIIRPVLVLPEQSVDSLGTKYSVENHG